MQKIFISLCFISLVYLGSDYLFNVKLPDWRYKTESFLDESRKVPLTSEAWLTLLQQSETLPDFYPFTILKDSVVHVQKALSHTEAIKQLGLPINPQKKEIDLIQIREMFGRFHEIALETAALQKKLKTIPDKLLHQNQQQLKTKITEKLAQSEKIFDQIKRLEQVIDHLEKENARILLLLQNTNEPRSTGGFIGSFVVLDFQKKSGKVTYKFSDIYALDRKIPEEKKRKAPEFFHGLSPKISLRDANFYPHFPESARNIQGFFTHAEEKSPNVVLALNLDALAPILEVTGPIYLDQWDTYLDHKNYAMLLQFLVEAKVAGRYQVKEPVLQFAEKLLSKIPQVEPQKWGELNIKNLVEKKSLQGFSSYQKLQMLFEEWAIDGKFIPQSNVDNFLFPEFISIGANKSEKFMWTKFYHQSTISPNGEVINTLEIKRTHTLKKGQIFSIFQDFQLPPNLQKLLKDQLLWKLGEGENRTVIRLHVPENASLISVQNPSGEITESDTFHPGVKVFDIPAFVIPEESLQIRLMYKTKIKRGSHNWRPYILETRTPSGRERTLFREIIQVKDGGKTSAETLNIGAPRPLKDDVFRTVVEWESASQ